MDNHVRKRFLSDVKYFWNYKGDIERLIDFSVEKLEKADPELAKAYKDMKYYTDVFAQKIAEIEDYNP